MHSVKSLSPKKHDLKIVKKSSPIKTQDGRDNLIGMTIKNEKNQVTHQINASKLACSTDVKLGGSPQKQPLKKLGKRKDESAVEEKGKKKIKSVFVSDSSAAPVTDNNTSVEKGIKFKLLKKDKSLPSFLCRYCCRHFRSGDQLRDHVAEHGDNPAFVCYVCGAETGAFSSLMAHCVKHSKKKNKNERLSKMKNDIPKKESQLPSSKSSIHCNRCEVSFHTTYKLASHSCSVTEQKREYGCAYCGHVSSSVDDYRLHVLSHSVSSHLCMHCNFKGPTKEILDKHQEICKKRPKNKKESLMFKCKKCSTEFTHRKVLNQHVKFCKGADCKVTLKSCSKCDSIFNNKLDYDNHKCNIDIHNVKTPPKSPAQRKKFMERSKAKKETFLCSICGNIFDNKLEHEKHREICFSEKCQGTLSEKTSALCPTCGNLFHSDVIKEHLKSCLQSPEKSGRDSDGTKAGSESDSHSTRRSARLVRRKSSFSEESTKCKEERPKVKRFKKKVLKNLPGRKGRQSKLGNENFRCIYCDLTFCSKSTLLRHKRMHSGNPYFSCKYCGKFFFRKDVYTRHEVNVHSKSSKTVFCCYYCRLYFADPPALKEHVLARHKENAFLPVKPELSKMINQPVRIKVEPEASKSGVTGKKQELNSETVDNDVSKPGNSVPSAPLLMKKCGTCLLSFENISEIEKHMKLHKKSPNPETLQAEVTGISQIDINEEKESSGGNVPESVFNYDAKNIFSSTVAQEKELFVDLPPQNESGGFESNDLNEASASDYVANSEKLKCNLCVQDFDVALIESHKNTKHTLVDWYRCLVCERSGPKQDMMDHMFSHMCKVGTFIVNSNANNLDSVLPYVLGQDPKEKNGHVDLISEAGSVEVPDEVLNCELPPLTDSRLAVLVSSKDEHTLAEIESRFDDQHSNTGDIPQVTQQCESASSYTEEDKCISSWQQSPVKEFCCNNDNAQAKYHSFKNINIDGCENLCNNSPQKSPNPIESSYSAKRSPIEESFQSIFEKSQDLLPKDGNIQNDIASTEESMCSTNNLCDENVTDNTNFSQLRYLLENFKKNNSSKASDQEREIEASNSQLIDKPNTDCVQLRRLLRNGVFNSSAVNHNLNSPNSNQTQPSIEALTPIKHVERNLCTPVKNIQDISSFNNLPLDSMDLSVKASDIFKEHIPEQKEHSQSVNTCLRFDINQSGGKISEALPPLKQSLMNSSKLGRTTDMFKTNRLQNKILDFSDLLKIADSSSANDDSIFQCGEPLSLSNNSFNQNDNSIFSSSTDALKCLENNETFDEFTHHNFFKVTNTALPSTITVSPIQSPCDSKHMSFSSPSSAIVNPIASISDPKNISLSATNTVMLSPVKSPSDPKSVPLSTLNTVMVSPVKLSCDSKIKTLASPGKINNPVQMEHTEIQLKGQHNLSQRFGVSTTLCNKVGKQGESKPYYSSEYVDLFSQYKCWKCNRMFRDRNEYTKHNCLDCGKLAWTSKNNHVSNDLKYPETLHSLLSKREGRTPHQIISTVSKPESTSDDISNDSVLNLSRNSFTS